MLNETNGYEPFGVTVRKLKISAPVLNKILEAEQIPVAKVGNIKAIPTLHYGKIQAAHARIKADARRRQLEALEKVRPKAWTARSEKAEQRRQRVLRTLAEGVGPSGQSLNARLLALEEKLDSVIGLLKPLAG